MHLEGKVPPRNTPATLLPYALILVALAVLNGGLYFLLSPAEPSETVAAKALPYSESFDQPDLTEWKPFAGSWEVRDETLVQISPTGFDLGTVGPLSIEPDTAFQFESSIRYLGGSMGGGLLFNLQQTTSRQQSHMVRFNVDNNALYLIYGYFDDANNFIGQGSAALNTPPASNEWQRLGVQVEPGTYQLTLDGQVVAQDIPLLYNGGSIGLITSSSQVAFDDLYADLWNPGNPSAGAATEAQQTQPPTAPAVEGDTSLPEVGTLLYADDFMNTGGDTPWQFFSGDWAFEPGKLVQRQREGFDFGVSHRDIFREFAFRATLTHLDGVGGGLLFNLPNPTSKNGGHMVRYVEDGSVLAWGHFTDSGSFVGDGSAQVPMAGLEPHILEVRSNGTTFSVLVDNAVVTQGQPLFSSEGHLGLTTSQSVVAFETIQIYGLGMGQVSQLEPTPTAMQLDLSSTAGEWVNEGGVITQMDSTSFDFVAGVGIAAEAFSASVDVLLPTGEALADSGGGIVFHMNGRDNPAMGNMVRFGSGGKEIFWGGYNEQGIFSGLGGSPLTLEAGVPQTLTIVVGAESYRVEVNGEPVVTDLPLQQSSGWIGLISYQGPVTFSNFQLTIGGGGQ